MTTQAGNEIANSATHQLHGANLFNAGKLMQKIVKTVVIVILTTIALVVIGFAADDPEALMVLNILAAAVALMGNIYILLMFYYTGEYLKLSVGKQTSSVIEQETAIFCSNCGVRASDNPGQFCEECGNKL